MESARQGIGAAADLSVWSGSLWTVFLVIVLSLLAITALAVLLGTRYVANNRIGIVEKLWSLRGSLAEGRMVALNGEAGFQAELLRGGLHLFYWPWQYRVHRHPLTTVPQGKIGYVFARDGEALRPEQTLGQSVECNSFQDARGFLMGAGNPDGLVGQRGRQRAILREGVYAINLALFVVLTEDEVCHLSVQHHDDDVVLAWRKQLAEIKGFDPVVIGQSLKADTAAAADTDADANDRDTIGVVTVHDGPTPEAGQIIAPAVGNAAIGPLNHNNFQAPEAFLRAGGRRGRQYATLTDGTYFINRWFATVEIMPKTVVPIGFVGVVVSYYGKQGQDLSGAAFRHGERVADDERGVRANTLGPGKYPFNTYAGHVHLVPTTNFVLHWITGRTENHRYDETLRSIDLVTADAYEPLFPLSVVVHIDYQKAPNVVQRFGDVKKLITQTLDPMLSAYFRDIAHKKAMLELLHERDLIQREAKKTLRDRFAEFDIELVDVLIGKPATSEANDQIETLLEQLRQRQLSREQVATYDSQRIAAEKLQELRLAQAGAEMQTELTKSQVQIEIVRNRAEASLAEARKRAEQTVVTADAEGKAKALIGEGEAARVRLEGEAEAAVLRQKIESLGEPRLYSLIQIAAALSNSKQPLVPERLFVSGASGNGDAGKIDHGMLGTLIDLLVAEKVGAPMRGDEAGVSTSSADVARAPAV
ncbi:MAG: hypothetical protein HYV63_34385 [Candidatus Schekmanbacteria bacterium]|nr:hypothetical protein [Candidatus Schekmanbacteria bacterium]